MHEHGHAGPAERLAGHCYRCLPVTPQYSGCTPSASRAAHTRLARESYLQGRQAGSMTHSTRLRQLGKLCSPRRCRLLFAWHTTTAAAAAAILQVHMAEAGAAARAGSHDKGKGAGDAGQRLERRFGDVVQGGAARERVVKVEQPVCGAARGGAGAQLFARACLPLSSSASSASACPLHRRPRC